VSKDPDVDEYIESLRKAVAESEHDYGELSSSVNSALIERGVAFDGEDDLRLFMAGADLATVMLVNFIERSGEGPLLTGLMEKLVDGYMAGVVHSYDSKDDSEATG
jgi:hypothetical protein